MSDKIPPHIRNLIIDMDGVLWRGNTPLDFSGFERIYRGGRQGPLRLVEGIELEQGASRMSGLDRFLSRWFARPLISGLNQGIRRLLNNRVTETAAGAHFVTNYSDGAHLILYSNRRVDGGLSRPRSLGVAQLGRGFDK